MSSWLSGGLSQFSSITDQISSFTKDVLTETTEEIEGRQRTVVLINAHLRSYVPSILWCVCVHADPTAELQVARKKIEHLEDVNSHYKTEVCIHRQL